VQKFGCKKNQKENYAFLGGKIVNATSRYIVLSKNNTLLDTVKLDVNNRFNYKINNLKPGFYNFKYAGDMQSVFLEPKDSVTFRLNTLEFDESLVFTGVGAKKNNYFINEFLQNEIEEQRVFKYCQLDAKIFLKRIDSIKDFKYQKLKTFKTKYPSSVLFNDIAQLHIDYNANTRKEIYPFIHYKKQKCDILKTLPGHFYAHRRTLNYNNKAYKNVAIYNRFLRAHINNLALEKHMTRGHDVHFNRTSLSFSLDKLELIDRLIRLPNVKNKLLFNTTFSFLNNNNDANNQKVLLQSFYAKATNKDNIASIKALHLKLEGLRSGKKFPNTTLLNYSGDTVFIDAVIAQPTAVYFWSIKHKNHFIKSHIKARELKSKYPEINFLAINIDQKDNKEWLKMLKESSLPLDNEYIMKDARTGLKPLSIYPMSKVFLLDKKGIIISSHPNMLTTNFEEQILGFVSR